MNQLSTSTPPKIHPAQETALVGTATASPTTPTPPPAHIVTAARNRIRLTGSIGNVFLVSSIGYLRRHPWMRVIAAAIGILCIAGWVIQLPGLRSDYFLIVAALLTFAAVVGASKEIDFYIGEPDEVIERRETEERLKSQGTASPYEFLDLDSKRLSEYYAINQNQTRAGFRWALIVMLLGFATIIIGIWLFYLRADAHDKTLTGLSVATGLVTDFIAATFIYLNNNTQKLALYYYGRLASLQNLALSIRLADTHEDSADKATARNKIIDRLLELSSTGDIAFAVPGPLSPRRSTSRHPKRRDTKRSDDEHAKR